MTYTPVKGDRVRVVLEGEVESVSRGQVAIGGPIPVRNWIVPDAPHVVSIEKVEPPAKVFKPGDTVKGKATGFWYTVTATGYFDWTASRHFEDTPPLKFSSDGYEKIKLGEVPF